MEAVAAITAVDHLLLGAPDLDRGVAWIEARAGVRASAGGSHPGKGTRNALLALGSRRYLEILAPDPAQPAMSGRLATRLQQVAGREPRLILWAAATTDLDDLVRRAGAANLELEGPLAGSRSRPDGEVVRWRVAIAVGATADRLEGALPFFIEWQTPLHPSLDSPAGCDLLTLDLASPYPDELRDVLACLGIEAVVRTAKQNGLSARLQTPLGVLDLE
ncbi:MAG: VOC family protein [Acidobacteriota bacterium]